MSYGFWTLIWEIPHFNWFVLQCVLTCQKHSKTSLFSLVDNVVGRVLAHNNTLKNFLLYYIYICFCIPIKFGNAEERGQEMSIAKFRVNWTRSNVMFILESIFNLGQLESPHRWLHVVNGRETDSKHGLMCFFSPLLKSTSMIPSPERHFKMMTCRLADPATSLNHRNHSFWNTMKPLCDILWWLSCKRRVKNINPKTTCLETSITSCNPPRFRDDLIGIARPRPMCENTVVVGSDGRPPKMETTGRTFWLQRSPMIPKNHILLMLHQFEGQVAFETSFTRFQKTSKRWLFVIFFLSTGLIILMGCHWASSILEQDLEGFASFPFIGIKK